MHGDWEVGLSEIIYPKTWYNLKRGESIAIQCQECGDVQPEFTTEPKKRDYAKVIGLSAGYYKSMSDLIDELNASLERAYAEPIDDWKDGDTDYYVRQLARPKFTFNPANNKVYLLLQGKTSIRMTSALRQILGFTSEEQTIVYNRRRRPENISRR